MRALKALAVLGMGLMLTLMVFPWMDALRDTMYHPTVPTLHEYINAGDNTEISVSSDNWAAQVFVVSSTYDLTSVKVKLWRTSGTGTLTVALYAADGSGYPTGSALKTGTMTAATISLISPGTWQTVTFSAVQSMSVASYDVVLHYSGTGVINWCVVGGGVGCSVSSDGGTTWAPYGGGECIEPPEEPPF
jgi:hypothetical protein